MNWVASAWDTIWEVLGWFKFVTFIDEWEEGVVLQAGKFRRVLKPGWRLHCPLKIDEIYTMNVRLDAMELDEQVLTTADDVEIVIRVVLMWSIFDIKKCILDVEDAEDTLKDIAVGFVQELVEETEWVYIKTKEFRKKLKKLINRQSRKWGMTVPKTKIKDLAKTRVYRIFGGL